MTTELRPLLQRILMLAILLLALEGVYRVVHYPREISSVAPYERQLTAASTAQALYLGDCSDVYQLETDDNGTAPVSIHEYWFARDAVAHGAHFSELGLQPEHYRRWLESLLARQELRGKHLVVTVNLRAFAPHITYEHIYTPILNKRLVMSDPSFSKLLQRYQLVTFDLQQPTHDVLKGMVDRAESKAFESSLAYPNQRAWLNALEGQPIAESFVRDFGFELYPDHPYVKAYDHITSLCAKNGTVLTLLIVPVNIRSAEDEAGSALSQLIRQNVQWLISRYEGSYDVRMIDVSDALGPECFLNDHSTSHLTAEGKRRVAESLAGR